MWFSGDSSLEFKSCMLVIFHIYLAAIFCFCLVVLSDAKKCWRSRTEVWMGINSYGKTDDNNCAF